MPSPDDADEARMKELQISFSDGLRDDEVDEIDLQASGNQVDPDFNESGISEHKDDKLT